jgi:hypothetical protein
MALYYNAETHNVESVDETQTVCDDCGMPVRVYGPSGYQHVYRALSSRHEIPGVHEVKL